MRKKILLLICVAAMASVSFAQTLSSNWNTSLGELRENAQGNDLVYIDNAGNIYVTGLFTQDVSIGNSHLEYMGKSAYLAKLNESGAIQWAVALQGNITPKYICGDNEGNIYVASTSDGDEIILGSTDNVTQELQGNTSIWEDGTQNNTIIVKYDTNGVLKKGVIYLHENDNWMADCYVNPMGLSIINGTVYIALNIAGNTKVGNQDFTGSNLPGEDGPLTLSAIRILTLDNTLNYQKETASIVFTAAGGDAKISSFTMTDNDNDLYAAFYAPASVNVTAGNSSFTVESDYDNSGWLNNYHRNLGIFRINSEGIIDLHKSYQSQSLFNAYTIGYESVKHSFISNNAWIITGSYYGEFLFDESAPETGDYTSAPYFVIFNKETGNEVKNYYGVDNTILNASGVGSALVFSEYINEDKISNLKVYDFGTKNITTLETTETGTTINGIAASGSKIAISKGIAENNMGTVTVNMNTLSNLSGVDTPATKATEIKLYPNPAVDVINLSEACDVTIANIQGSVVKTATAATQIPVTDLNTGYYVAKIKTTEGVTVIPFIKK